MSAIYPPGIPGTLGDSLARLSSHKDFLCVFSRLQSTGSLTHQRDGRDDYVYVDENGALWFWWNSGEEADTTMAMDGLRFADIDGDGVSLTFSLNRLALIESAVA